MHDTACPIVYVVDDDRDILKSVSVLVESVGLEARGFESANALLDNIDPDSHGCIVTDVRMPGMSGLELQTRLHTLGIKLPLIILTGFGDVPVAVRAMKQGAIDFLEKPYQPDELLERVQTAIAQDTESLKARRIAAETRQRLDSLTRREHEVLEFVVSGAANKVVAIELGISERTVEIHRGRVMKKMATRSLAELVTLLERQGTASL